MDNENVAWLYYEMLFIYKEKWNHKFVGQRVEIEMVILTEVTQTQKNKCHMFPLIWRSFLQIFNYEYITLRKNSS